MKVLWFTNTVAPDVYRHYGKNANMSGPWMWELASRFKNLAGYDLHICAATGGLPVGAINADGIEYHVINRKRIVSPLISGDFDVADDVKRLIDAVKPDIIHVHGTEHRYATYCFDHGYADRTLVTIQGLLIPYSRWINGSLTLSQRFKATSFRDLFRGAGIFWDQANLRKRGRTEERILRDGKHFGGRTSWDRAWLEAYNPKAKYYYTGEILRDEFFEGGWDINHVRKRSFIFTNVSGPIKGVEILIKCLAILARRFPDVELRIAGGITMESSYGATLIQLIRNLGVSENIKYLGYLNSEQMAKAMRETHVFVSSSYADNSPNSLAEAQCIGMPCVATDVGGISDLLEHNVTGLLAPVGDEAILASRIARLMEDDAECQSLSNNARIQASKRHDGQLVLSQVLDAYNKILNR